jgi:hypothetical protein
MLSSVFAEDLFTSFYLKVVTNDIQVQHQDFSPIVSFYNKISEGGSLTQNQANFILKLLEKYKNIATSAGLDYTDQLDNIRWKQVFRILDLSKKIYIEKGKAGNIEICLKFPFQLKKDFEEEIDSHASTRKTSVWDAEEKVRRLNIYDYNLISLYEFAVKHNFEIDESFMNVVADVEEIWQNTDAVLPYCHVGIFGVELINAPDDAKEYFNENKKFSPAHDLMLAKSMGYLLKEIPGTAIEKIAASPENSFWINDYKTFFTIYKELNHRVCIILDRANNNLEWLQNFVAAADDMLISRDEIKVCFRENKDSKTGINEWVKSAGVGGKVETGKILIFESKPAKWLFKNEHDVKLLVTNNIYPPTNIMAKDWFNSHPFVIYLSETKPTKQRGHTIVEL